jgi:DNA-binding response OmpR family regulator
VGHEQAGRTVMVTANDNEARGLEGIRVLIVEDDPLLLMDLESTLASAGATVVGLCRTLPEALSWSEAPDFAVAVLDFRLGNETVSPLARRLANRGVPFILYTGQNRDEPSLVEWRDFTVKKPAPPTVILAAVSAALRR